MRVITDLDYLDFLGKQESQFLINPSELTDKVLDRLNGVGDAAGDLLPWSKTHNLVQLRPAEVSIWAGINGHGKSQKLGMVVAWLLKTTTCLVASMEMKPEATMERMVRQIAGTNEPAENYVRKFMDWTDNKLWIYDQTDSVEPERIIGMIHYAASIGIKHIVIDSLMKCGISPDDYSKQKEFVDRLCWAAKNNNIHIHLVHHIRKGDKEGNTPDKFDIKGAGEITDLVDNVFIVHRNKIKEQKLQGLDLNKPENQDLIRELEAKPDSTLTVAKQRHGEWEGQFKFWFNKPSMQYTPDQSGKVMEYRYDR